MPELQVVEFLGVVLHPVGRSGPEQEDEHHRHELEEVQVQPRPARHVLDLSQDAARKARRREDPAATPKVTTKKVKSARNGRIIADLSWERCRLVETT